LIFAPNGVGAFKIPATPALFLSEYQYNRQHQVCSWSFPKGKTSRLVLPVNFALPYVQPLDRKMPDSHVLLFISIAASMKRLTEYLN
jgi:hypothetical protein